MIASLLALPLALASQAGPNAVPAPEAAAAVCRGDGQGAWAFRATADNDMPAFQPSSLRNGAGAQPLQPAGIAALVAEPRLAALLPAPAPVAAGAPSGALVDLSLSGTGGITVPRAADGLFYVHGMVNGVVVRFLVDTGATSIVLTADDAARAGVPVADSDFRYNASTAGGKTAMARVRVTRLVTGATERRDVEAAVVNSGLSVSLLGQAWLAQLRSLSISGNVLRLE